VHKFKKVNIDCFYKSTHNSAQKLPILVEATKQTPLPSFCCKYRS